MAKNKKAFIGAYIIIAALFLIFTLAATVNSESAKKSNNTITIDTGAPVTLGLCNPCHLNIDDIENPKLIFKHNAHLQLGVDCKNCHKQFPHTQEGNVVIPMDLCFSCHGINHGPQGSMAPGDCELCHPKDMELQPVNHTPAFKASDHKENAVKNLFNCKTCHKIDFCQNCHTVQKIIPKDHENKPVWEKEHGPLSENRDSCNICHADNFCMDCHKTEVPHNVVWLQTHNLEAKGDQAQCNKCHDRETYCQDCHHAGIKDKVLEQANCKCHEEKMQGKVGEIPDVRIAVHKAHFNMTRTEPFPCWKCHLEGVKLGHDQRTFQVCYTCHGRYDNGVLIAKYIADELCYQCHPTVFVEQLKEETPQIVNISHNATQFEFRQKCFLCHSVGYCDSCHIEKNIKTSVIADLKAKMRFTSVTTEYVTSEETRKGTPAKIELGGPTTMGNCRLCHPNIDDFSNPILIFPHEVHLKRGMDCKACHQKYPHLNGEKSIPSMDFCYSCHGLEHSEKGVVAAEDCYLCHPRGMNMEPGNHTPQFKEKDHKDLASVNLFNCKTCHQTDFCEQCHNLRKATPQDHKDKGLWRQEHGRTDKGIDNCNICHNVAFCDSCHGTRVPHNIFWLKTHNTEAKKDRFSCDRCHKDEGYCQDCHHAETQNQKLVAETCKCHSDQMVGDVKDIKNRGMAVHKAHFAMTQTEPFECWKCHIEGVKLEHNVQSFNLCYKCHGRYQNGKLLAKWPGTELCYRCHPPK